LFILAIDPLIRNINADLDVLGLDIPTTQFEGVSIKVLAYADDITIICRNGDLQPIFSQYEALSRLSGLVLNADKTEILNLIDSPIQVSRITYLGESLIIGRLDNIKICGVWLCRDLEAEYQLNITGRISIMENIVQGLKRRALSMNGRMILSKVFVLSQIVFIAQAYVIRNKELKKIERLVYSYVNGARELYGPERIARKLLKAPKSVGGLGGVHVNSFITTLKLRQFCKAIQQSRVLRQLQLSNRDVLDPLGVSVAHYLRGYYRKELKSVGLIPDMDQLVSICGIPLNLLITQRNKAYSIIRSNELESLYSVQQALLNNRLTRGAYNCIIRALPELCAGILMQGQAFDSGVAFPIICRNAFTDIGSLNARLIKQELTNRELGELVVNVQQIYKDPLLRIDQSPANVWLIKNPTLRNTRLKVLYKDIYCNERRHRFGIADSPNCVQCVVPETISHQLIDCPNAHRFWLWIGSFLNVNIARIDDLIVPTKLISHEIIKSVVIKKLLQIDRSRTISIAELKAEIAHYLRVEAITSGSNATEFTAMIETMSSA